MSAAFVVWWRVLFISRAEVAVFVVVVGLCRRCHREEESAWSGKRGHGGTAAEIQSATPQLMESQCSRRNVSVFIFCSSPILGPSGKGESHCKGSGRFESKLLLWALWQAVHQTPGIWQPHQLLWSRAQAGTQNRIMQIRYDIDTWRNLIQTDWF